MEIVKKQSKFTNRARFLTASALNAAVMVASGVYGGAKGHSGFLVEAAHDLGDATVYGSRAAVEGRQFSDWKHRGRFLYATYGLTSFLSGAFAVKAGVDIMASISEGFQEPNTFEFGMAAGVAVANQTALSALKGGDLTSENLRHAIHHGTTDRNASVVYAGTLACGALGIPAISEVGATVMGSYVAYEMRPTPHNIAHHSE